MILFLILGLIIGGLSVIFVFQNITPITVSFFTWHIDGSLSVILLLALLSGMLVSVLVLLPSFIKAEWQLRKLKKANQKLEDDLMLARPVVSKVTEPAPVGGEPTVDVDEELKN
ncbi:MAG: LapA family protein [Patescibacteria group bacterium]